MLVSFFSPRIKFKMVVLKGVPRILSPQLLFAMSRMGHGDELGRFEYVCS